MQPRPTAAELLATVAQVLDEEVVPALTGPAQHHARVAANLVGIVVRELELAPAAAERERQAWIELLGDDAGAGRDLADLRADLAARLRAGMADDANDDTHVWSVLMATVRDDLAISKPGHDNWDGR